MTQLTQLIKLAEATIVVIAFFAFALGFIALMACILIGSEGKVMEYSFFAFLFGGVVWAYQ
jgi:hypothetical protein